MLPSLGLFTCVPANSETARMLDPDPRFRIQHLGSRIQDPGLEDNFKSIATQCYCCIRPKARILQHWPLPAQASWRLKNLNKTWQSTAKVPNKTGPPGSDLQESVLGQSGWLGFWLAA